GHLVLSQHLLGVKMPGLTFEIFLHFGTLISVFWVFRQRISKIIKSFLVLHKKEERSGLLGNPDRWFGILLLVGSVPTAIIAFLLSDYVEEAFASIKFVGLALLVTGALLWVADILPGGNKDIKRTGFA